MHKRIALGRLFLIARKVGALPQGLRGRAPYTKNKNKAAWTVQAPYLKNKPHFTPKTPPKNDIIYVCRKWDIAV